MCSQYPGQSQGQNHAQNKDNTQFWALFQAIVAHGELVVRPRHRRTSDEWSGVSIFHLYGDTSETNMLRVCAASYLPSLITSTEHHWSCLMASPCGLRVSACTHDDQRLTSGRQSTRVFPIRLLAPIVLPQQIGTDHSLNYRFSWPAANSPQRLSSASEHFANYRYQCTWVWIHSSQCNVFSG
jgi:hypothetical protein